MTALPAIPKRRTPTSANGEVTGSDRGDGSSSARVYRGAPGKNSWRYLVHDRDCAFQPLKGRAKALGIEDVTHLATFALAERLC